MHWPESHRSRLPLRCGVVTDLKGHFPAVRRAFATLPALSLLIFLTLALFADCRMKTAPETSTSSAASTPANDPRSIHMRAIAIDMHADTPQRMVDEGADIEQRLPDGHLDAVRMKEGGLDAQFFSIWVEPDLYGAGGPTAIKR